MVARTKSFINFIGDVHFSSFKSGVNVFRLANRGNKVHRNFSRLAPIFMKKALIGSEKLWLGHD